MMPRRLTSVTDVFAHRRAAGTSRLKPSSLRGTS